MSRDNGGPAFPHDRIEVLQDGSKFHFPETGMTLRDWFAGQALAGLLADPSMSDQVKETGINTAHEFRARIARLAYLNADAMIAERAKNGD